VLTSTQREAIREETAKGLVPTSTYAEWESKQTDVGVCAMIKSFTERIGFAKQDDLLQEGVKWKAVTAEHLTDKRTEYFNTKDLDALGKIFKSLHDVTQKELDEILGEALDVTEA